MKKLVFLVITTISLSSVFAQSKLKLAHINSQKLLDTMPSRKLAMKEIQENEEKAIEILKKMEGDLQKTYNEYLTAKEKGTMTPTILKSTEEEIEKMQKDFQKKQQDLQQELNDKRQTLNTPIMKRVQKAIDLVAERNKITYVIDASVTLYSKPGIDITNEVITELLKLDAEETKKPN